MPTHYETLGVPIEADTEAIRRAYVRVAKANHPDRRQSDDASRRARAEERIRAANAAWHVLRDPVRRADYDRTLRLAQPDPAPRSAGASASPTGPRSSGGFGGRPAPPSGFVVPAAHASFWRYAPIVVIIVVLLGVLVVSAYATSGGTGTGVGADGPETRIGVGDCVRVVMISGSTPAPAPVACGTSGAYQVQAVVDTPRPCPTGTEAVARQKTTYCLARFG